MPKAKPLSLFILAAAGVVLGLTVFFLSTPAPEPGSVYDRPVPVADFTLTDQTGQPFTFSSTRGKVVLMTFLFTHCGDVCPYGAVKMKAALDLLGGRSGEVELVVVTTDPERDTVPVVADYSRDLGLYDRWHYTTGSPEALQQVYRDLKITVIKAEEELADAGKKAPEEGIALPADRETSPLAGLTNEQIAAGETVARKYAGGYNIAHSTPFWVIDRQGRVRASLDVTASPAQIARAAQNYF